MAAEKEGMKGPKGEEMQEQQVEKARAPSLVPKISLWPWSAPCAEGRAGLQKCSLSFMAGDKPGRSSPYTEQG